MFACMLGGDDGRTLLMCAAPDFLEHNRVGGARGRAAHHDGRRPARRVAVAGSPGGTLRVSVLEFGILGPLEVRHEGRALDLGGPRGRTLLGVLSCAAR